LPAVPDAACGAYLAFRITDRTDEFLGEEERKVNNYSGVRVVVSVREDTYQACVGLTPHTLDMYFLPACVHF
jgi:hypothetical protein